MLILNELNKYKSVNLPSCILLINNNKANLAVELNDFIKLQLCMLDKSDNCNCHSCDLFNAESVSHPDFLHIDSREYSVGIDDVRKIVNFSKLMPAITESKFILIDGVENLSLAAKNALLKTLEEPIPNQYFILTTECEHEVLPTILSRCVKIKVASDASPYAEQDHELSLLLDGLVVKINAKQTAEIQDSINLLKKYSIGDILDSLYFLMYETVLKFTMGGDSNKNISGDLGLDRAFNIASWALYMRKMTNGTKFNEEIFIDQLMRKLSKG